MKLANRERQLEKLKDNPWFADITPMHNIRGGYYFAGLPSAWAALYPADLYELSLVERNACPSCPIACRSSFEIKSGRWGGTKFSVGGFVGIPGSGMMQGIKDYRESMLITP